MVIKFFNKKALFLYVCLCVITIPPLYYGPYLPITDLLGYVGLNAYPGDLSFGPNHYYIFQFSYIFQHIIIRMMTVLGIIPKFQVVILYLLTMYVYFYIIYFILNRFIKSKKNIYIYWVFSWHSFNMEWVLYLESCCISFYSPIFRCYDYCYS